MHSLRIPSMNLILRTTTTLWDGFNTLGVEPAASQAMLDEKHSDLLQAENDINTYTLGRIGQHNVVLACLPSGTTGINAAAIAARELSQSSVWLDGRSRGRSTEQPN